ncbi:hypothetical protein SMICM17S_07258 [Streptomyces microflavus]
MADDLRELGAGEDHLDRVAGVAGGHGGHDRLRAGGALGAEAAADVLGDDRDVFGAEAEDPGEALAHGVGTLAGVVDGEVSVHPPRGGGVRLHGVVVQRGQPVGGVDLDGGGGEGPLEIAPLADGGEAPVGLLRRVEARVVLGEGHVVLGALVLDEQAPRARPGGLRGVGDDEGDRPAVVRDPVALEDGEDRVLWFGEGRRVVVGEHGVHTGDGERVDRPYGGDPAGGDGGRDRPGVQSAGRGVFGRVPGGAGDLVPGLPADDGRTGELRGVGHGGGVLRSVGRGRVAGGAGVRWRGRSHGLAARRVHRGRRGRRGGRGRP